MSALASRSCQSGWWEVAALPLESRDPSVAVMEVLVGLAVTISLGVTESSVAV